MNLKTQYGLFGHKAGYFIVHYSDRDSIVAANIGGIKRKLAVFLISVFCYMFLPLVIVYKGFVGIADNMTNKSGKL